MQNQPANGISLATRQPSGHISAIVTLNVLHHLPSNAHHKSSAAASMPARAAAGVCILAAPVNTETDEVGVVGEPSVLVELSSTPVKIDGLEVAVLCTTPVMKVDWSVLWTTPVRMD